MMPPRGDGHDPFHTVRVIDGGGQGEGPALGQAHDGGPVDAVVVQDRDHGALEDGVVGDALPRGASALLGPVQGQDPVVLGQVGDEVAPAQGGAVHPGTAEQQHRRGLLGAFDDDAQVPLGRLDVLSVEVGRGHEVSSCRPRQRWSMAGSSVSRNPYSSWTLARRSRRSGEVSSSTFSPRSVIWRKLVARA